MADEANQDAQSLTPYGTATSSRRMDGDQVKLEVEAPHGTTAITHLGDGRVEQVGAGTRHLSRAHHMAAVRSGR